MIYSHRIEFIVGPLYLLLTCLASPVSASNFAEVSVQRIGFDPHFSDNTDSPIAHVSMTDPNIGNGEVTINSITGTIKTFAHSVPFNGAAVAEVSSHGRIDDSFTLHDTNLVDGAQFNLSVHILLDGTMSADANAPFVTVASAFSRASVISAASIAEPNATIIESVHLDKITFGNITCFLDGCPAVNAPHVADLASLTLNITNGSSFNLTYLTDSVTINGATADFSATAKLSFDLPIGATITSRGGYFQAAPVPLPATPWMFVPALGALGFMRRRVASSRTTTKHTNTYTSLQPTLSKTASPLPHC